jgi:Rhodopirellula transposase DDE domain
MRTHRAGSALRSCRAAEDQPAGPGLPRGAGFESGSGVIVDLIANTTATTGLSVRAVLDTGQYPTGLSYSDKDIAAIPLVRHDFHGDWNCTLLPRDTP